MDPNTHQHLLHIVKKLPDDYAPWGNVTEEQRRAIWVDCSAGCRFYIPLEGALGANWGVCTNPKSHRVGCIHCTNIAKIRESARAGKIELASQVLVEDVYVKEMETVRDALDAISNNSWGGALLTDLSSVADFRLEGED